jgi:hypothetical protein
MPSVVGVADPDPLLRDLRRVEIARGYMHISLTADHGPRCQLCRPVILTSKMSRPLSTI